MWKFPAGGASGSGAASSTSAGCADVAMESAETSTAVLAEGLRTLFARGELCDMALLACGERFPAHKAVLAAMSDKFRDFLRKLPSRAEGDSAQNDPMQGMLEPVEPVESPQESAATASPRGLAGAPAAAAGAPAASPVAPPAAAPPAAPATTSAAQSSDSSPVAAAEPVAASVPSKAPRKSAFLELRVCGIKTAEALRITLSYVYGVGTGAPWKYAPSSAEVNKDVLLLARQFGLAHLHEYAARWLAKGLTTANVVERLVTCEEFKLGLLREKIIEQLTANPTELTVVSSSMEIMKHPRILQDLLMHVASLCSGGAPEKESAPKEPAKEPTPMKEAAKVVQEPPAAPPQTVSAPAKKDGKADKVSARVQERAPETKSKRVKR